MHPQFSGMSVLGKSAPPQIEALHAPRDRDDYVFPVPDGGYSSVTVDAPGPDTEHRSVEAWLQGYEAPARQTLVNDLAPCQGPLLPMHPYGFARWKRLET